MTEPLVSVISTNFNHGRFLRDTLDSVLRQSYKNIEHLVIDGGSTDDSVSILRQYPNVQWLSEKDHGSYEAFDKGLKRSQGKYIMQCAVTDGYLDQDWIRQCVEVMEKNSDISLVWGLPQYMSEDGRLGELSYPQFAQKEPPQGRDFLYYWLATFFWFPEGNFCVRREVFEQCFRSYNETEFRVNGVVQFDPWMEFNYHFHKRGYLPHFIRRAANFGRIHGDQQGQQWATAGTGNTVYDSYIRLGKEYRKKLLSGQIEHRYRSANGEIIPGTFSRNRFIREQVFSSRLIVSELKYRLRPIVQKTVRWPWAVRLVRSLKRLIKV